MAGALSRLVKRLSKTDSKKNSARELQKTPSEADEARYMLDVVSQQNEQLQAEKQQLAVSVLLLQQKLSGLGTHGCINGGYDDGFTPSDDGQTGLSGSSNIAGSSNFQDSPTTDPHQLTPSRHHDTDLWTNIHPPTTTGYNVHNPRTTPSYPSHNTSRPPISYPSSRGSVPPPLSRASSGHLSTGARSAGGDSHSVARSGDSSVSMAQALVEVLHNLKDAGSALNVACQKGWLEVVAAMLDSGADVNEMDQTVGMTPLHMALTNGHAEVAAALLHRGAFPNLVASNGQTPLQMAVARNMFNIVPVLAHYGAELDARGMTSQSVLHDAAKKGDVEMVRTLLLAGASMESKDQQGRTPLLTAILEGEAAVVEVLVGVGANIHSKSLRGMTAREALRMAIAERKCPPEKAARIQSMLWVSDGVKSRRGSRASDEQLSGRTFCMHGDDP